jgi:hypothetical protein
MVARTLRRGRPDKRSRIVSPVVRVCRGSRTSGLKQELSDADEPAKKWDRRGRYRRNVGASNRWYRPGVAYAATHTPDIDHNAVAVNVERKWSGTFGHRLRDTRHKGPRPSPAHRFPALTAGSRRMPRTSYDRIGPTDERHTLGDPLLHVVG